MLYVLLGLVCCLLQFVPQFYVVVHSFSIVDAILPFPSFLLFADHFLCNPWVSYSPLTFAH